MTKVADHLVGRAAELEAIDRALGELCDGGTAPLVFQGEPGIGKTRLVAELAKRADGRGCTVLGGSASELERDLPFFVFVDALDEYVAGCDPRVVASCATRCAASSAVLPSLSYLTSAAGPSCRMSANRAHRAVRELLERLAAAARSSWRSTTSLGGARRGGAAHGASAQPARAAVLVVMAARPRQCRIASRRPSSGPTARAASPRLDLGGPSLARRPASCSAMTWDARGRTSSTRRRAATRSTLQQLARSQGGGAGRPPDPSGAGGRAAARCGDRVAGRGARAPFRPAHSPVLCGAASRVHPFEPDLGRRRGRRERCHGHGAFDDPSTSGSVSHRPTSRDASASVTRSCAGRCTRAPPAAGCSAPTSAAHRSSPSAARRGGAALNVEFAARHGTCGRGRAHRGTGRSDPTRPCQRRPVVSALLAPDARQRARRAAIRSPSGPGPSARRAGASRRSHVDLLESIAFAPAEACRPPTCNCRRRVPGRTPARAATSRRMRASSRASSRYRTRQLPTRSHS